VTFGGGILGAFFRAPPSSAVPSLFDQVGLRHDVLTLVRLTLTRPQGETAASNKPTPKRSIPLVELVAKCDSTSGRDPSKTHDGSVYLVMVSLTMATLELPNL